MTLCLNHKETITLESEVINYMPENCPLTNCKHFDNGTCANEQMKNIKNSVSGLKEGASDCVDCFEAKC